ncbi:putative ABC transport system ATP-binding protein [Bradyrhizobium sp. USDA 4524]|uniref:ABC transporter ATP-binding protein n=1 Tax=unclassified Bradyrhizobium TaxID=2631580 RepID=UPI0020A2154D|nr:MULTISPECIES: ABC transporter ATP-binding protein [unclassified Bradyrhizobium]MCP1843693.1 putative ABC transport system ATP-binding protein [Bradyrhizobium sp. USDA 4538]MCP1904259.1 putative ABC transport system ATP-binding protein [Bradyrhizobium sp. USDA 4537]MCP1990085.1 putative ABC transport system ATP-binding protein [Bradyrhizobium sp. USDA 4539]
MSPLVILDHIHKQHRLGNQAVQALSDVCLEIDRGEFVAVVGPSGSGKSTLLSILGCLDQPSRGRYLLHGENVFAQSKIRLSELRNRRVGIVFQNFNLLPRLTALENVALPLFYRTEPLRNPLARARAVLERVGLGLRMHHVPSKLSGGEQQRVAIARAIVNGPDLLLADEPTGALDTSTRDAILALLCQLQRTALTVVLVTHDPEVAACARRIIRLRDGAVVGEPERHVTS